MTVLEFKVHCPVCNGIIIIDARNGKIIRHFEADKRGEDDKPDPGGFDDALGKVADKKGKGDSTFADAMKKVSGRKKGLDSLFKDARDKAKNKDNEEESEDRSDFWD